MTDQQLSSTKNALEATSRAKRASSDLPAKILPPSAPAPLVNEDEPLPEDGQIKPDDGSASGYSIGGSLSPTTRDFWITGNAN